MEKRNKGVMFGILNFIFNLQNRNSEIKKKRKELKQTFLNCLLEQIE